MAQNTKNLIGLTGVPLVMVLGNSMLIPVLPTMKAKLDLTAFQTSFVITAFSIAAGLVIPFAGYLSDRFSRKLVISIALSLYGFGGLVAGLAALWWDDAYMMILFGRILQGIGAAGTAPIAMALVGDLFSGASESRGLGLLETSNGLGKVLSPIIGSLLGLIVWYAVFLAFPIICGVVLLIFLFLVREKKRKREPLPVKQYVKSISNVFRKHGRWLVPAFFIGSICLFTLFGVLFYLSDLLEETYKIDGVFKGGFLAIPLLAMSITAYITGAIIKKRLLLMRIFIIIGLLLLTTSYVLASFSGNVYVLIAILVIGSIGTGLILPCLNSMIIGAVKKSERGMITSLYNGVRFIGVAVGPPVFTWLLDFSTDVMFYSIAGLTGLFAVIAFLLIRPESKQKQTGAADKQKQVEDNEALQQMLEASEEKEEETPAAEEEDEEKQKQREMKEILGFDPEKPISTFLRRGRAKG
ncbi:MFS transporter [Brevibacillus humidisoli]|uniref:MFS transporter n=1 Tax=Brevibacillus humidisoli TaxID=2895522 RepID=UPI001E4EF39C|nr:MFS transporter [Brevibacillus humidisoli]UFJ41946.1 MFS transporter [Brevibacillus humidisoli]